MVGSARKTTHRIQHHHQVVVPVFLGEYRCNDRPKKNKRSNVTLDGKQGKLKKAAETSKAEDKFDGDKEGKSKSKKGKQISR